MIELNLLPIEQKQRADVRRQLERWQPAMVAVMAGTVACSLVGVFVGLLLNIHDSSLKSQLDSNHSSSNQKAVEITGQIQSLNFTISSLSAPLAMTRSWSHDLVRVINEIPDAITLTKLHVTSTGEVQLEGVAQNRLAFLSLQTALTNSQVLSHVTTTSTASKRENVPFIYHAQLR